MRETKPMVTWESAECETAGGDLRVQSKLESDCESWWLSRLKFSNLSISNIDFLLCMLQLYISKSVWISRHTSKRKNLLKPLGRVHTAVLQKQGTAKVLSHTARPCIKGTKHPGYHPFLTTQKSYGMKLKTPGINCLWLSSVTQGNSVLHWTDFWLEAVPH